MLKNKQNETYITIKVNELFAFIKQIFETIKRVNKLPIYKIVDWNEINGFGYCLIQISGTRGIMPFKPSEILKDNVMLKGFDQEDVVAITNFVNYEKLKPKAKVHTIDNLDSPDQTNISIKKSNGKIYRYSIKELRKNDLFSEESYLNSLSKIDVFRLGQMIGRSEAYKD